MKTVEELIEQVNEALVQLNWEEEPIELYRPIEYILSLGGKRIRPVLSLMACNLFTQDLTSAITPSLSLEIFHNFTLLHDDIMDKADVRRGKPTVHKKWNDSAAILSGDAMLIKSYQFLATCSPNKLGDLLPLFSQTALEVCEGQQYDMEFETRTDVRMEEYLEMIRLKTAVLLAGSLKVGAILGGGDRKSADALYAFGLNLGMAFQLRDDYLDTFGDQATFGKRIGGDICCGKKTFLLIEAYNKANEEQAASLNHWMDGSCSESEEEKINAVTKIYRDLSIDIACEEEVKVYFNKSVESLDKLQIDDCKLVNLRILAEKLMGRVS